MKRGGIGSCLWCLFAGPLLPGNISTWLLRLVCTAFFVIGSVSYFIFTRNLEPLQT